MYFSSSNFTKIRCRPGLRPGPRWGSLRRSPRPPSRLARGTVDTPPFLSLETPKMSAPSAPRFTGGPQRCEVHRVHQMVNPTLFALLTTTGDYMTVPRTRQRVMIRAAYASRHLQIWNMHLISRTLMLVANSSNRALRLGSLSKPAHKKRL